MKAANVDPQLINNVENKVANLRSEIDSYIVEAIRGNVALEEPKFKFYRNENAAGDKLETVSDALARLIEANYTLWNLEDIRRDKTNYTDEQRMRAMDEVATWNRIRNDAMDAINSKLVVMISRK